MLYHLEFAEEDMHERSFAAVQIEPELLLKRIAWVCKVHQPAQHRMPDTLCHTHALHPSTRAGQKLALSLLFVEESVIRPVRLILALRSMAVCMSYLSSMAACTSAMHVVYVIVQSGVDILRILPAPGPVTRTRSMY